MYTTIFAKTQHNYLLLSFCITNEEPSKMMLTSTYLRSDFNGYVYKNFFNVLDSSPFSEIVLWIFSSRQWLAFSPLKYCRLDEQKFLILMKSSMLVFYQAASTLYILFKKSLPTLWRHLFYFLYLSHLNLETNFIFVYYMK